MAEQKEKLLILGGTDFVGRQLVEFLLIDFTKDVYLFNRGKTNPDLFPKAKLIKGDRETEDLKKISGQQWDYIIDFSSYYPASLMRTLELINKDVKQYIYISTISVYSLKNYDGTFGIPESYEQVSFTEEEAIDISMKTYGKRKAACKVVLNEAEWLNKIIFRPSVIYGKYDPTDRFYYWLKKIKDSAGTILPDGGRHDLSLTFADDLVRLILSSLDGELASGTYNCSTHPPMKVINMMKY